MYSKKSIFISYSRLYSKWVQALHSNLERSLALHGRETRIFLDQEDLGSGHSWVSRLQAGLEHAEHLVLVAAPEALASLRVGDELEAFISSIEDWRHGRLHVAMLVATPLPVFPSIVQRVDFTDPGDSDYRRALRQLLGGLMEREDPRRLPELPDDLVLPEPPPPRLPPALRARLLAWLEGVLTTNFHCRGVASSLGLERNALDAQPSAACAASAAVALATADDDPIAAALRIVDTLIDELGEISGARVKQLEPLRKQLLSLHGNSPEAGLLRLYLKQIAADHDRLVAYFQQQSGLELLDRVYVRLQVRPDQLLARGDKASGLRLERDWSLRELLELDKQEHPWVTGRWVVRGDPGAGKTTLLRHLAAALAKEEGVRLVPLFESLPKLMQEREEILSRATRRLARVHPARGLASVLDRTGQEGRLLLLLDGLDEVPKEAKGEAEGFLRDLAARWPATPLVVTTRPIGYRRPGGGFLELDLLPLNSDRRREFLARWFGRASSEPDFIRADRELRTLETEPALSELAGNPLYLTLMALLLEQGTSPARNRTRLYDQVFELLLEGKHKSEPKAIDALAATREMLRYLGYVMTQDNRDSEPFSTLEARLYKPEADEVRAELERWPRWRTSMRPFLEDLSELTGILGPYDGHQADWRFWHRTFREALAAEYLEGRVRVNGTDHLVAHAKKVTGDESRWAEPYALLAGRMEDPDALVRTLVEANRALGLRALATAQGLHEETISEVLELTGNREEWQARCKAYLRIPELVGEPERALLMLDRLRRRTRDGNDLYFLHASVGEVMRLWPAAERNAEDLLRRFSDHIPVPSKDLFCWVRTKDGRVPLWRNVPPGEFLMGSPVSEDGRYADEGPQHNVTLISGFAMAAVPVTNAQYQAFDSQHPLMCWNDIASMELSNHPVVNVTWFASVAFCRWLSNCYPFLAGARLAQEEEWEYACRAGTTTAFWNGNHQEDLTKVGWYDKNSANRTHQVGQKIANLWGLYDMHGNVWEWTSSPHHADYKSRQHGVSINPRQVPQESGEANDPSSGSERVIRGGSAWVGARCARAAYRDWSVPGHRWLDQGFRVVVPTAESTRE